MTKEERDFMRRLVSIGMELGRKNPEPVADERHLLEQGVDQFLRDEIMRQLGATR